MGDLRCQLVRGVGMYVRHGDMRGHMWGAMSHEDLTRVQGMLQTTCSSPVVLVHPVALEVPLVQRLQSSQAIPFVL